MQRWVVTKVQQMVPMATRIDVCSKEEKGRNKPRPSVYYNSGRLLLVWKFVASRILLTLLLNVPLQKTSLLLSLSLLIS